MKSLEELRAIRERMQSQVSMRAEDHTHTRVVVGMATCGIAAGARPVLTAFADEVAKRGRNGYLRNCQRRKTCSDRPVQSGSGKRSD